MGQGQSQGPTALTLQSLAQSLESGCFKNVIM